MHELKCIRKLTMQLVPTDKHIKNPTTPKYVCFKTQFGLGKCSKPKLLILLN